MKINSILETLNSGSFIQHCLDFYQLQITVNLIASAINLTVIVTGKILQAALGIDGGDDDGTFKGTENLHGKCSKSEVKSHTLGNSAK